MSERPFTITMNLERNILPLITIELNRLQDALRCVIHTILYNRITCTVEPQSIDSTFERISYLSIGDPALSTHVDHLIQTVVQTVSHNFNGNPASPPSTSYCIIGFFQRKVDRTWLGEREQRAYWERWVLPIVISRRDLIHPTINDADTDIGQSTLLTALHAILQTVLNKRDHLPPLESTTSGISPPYPFDCSVVIGGTAESAFANANTSMTEWGLNTLKKMIQNGPPMLMKT